MRKEHVPRNLAYSYQGVHTEKALNLKKTKSKYLNCTKSAMIIVHMTSFSFRCTNGNFYVALGSSMGLALLVWVGGALLKQVL